MKDFTESVREIARSLIRQYLPSNRNIDFGDNCRSEEIANKVKSEIAKRLPKEKGHNLEDRNLILSSHSISNRFFIYSTPNAFLTSDIAWL